MSRTYLCDDHDMLCLWNVFPDEHVPFLRGEKTGLNRREKSKDRQTRLLNIMGRIESFGGFQKTFTDSQWGCESIKMLFRCHSDCNMQIRGRVEC